VWSEVALLFEGGDALLPLIVGRIVDPARRSPMPNVILDGERVQITAQERIELRCGKATIFRQDGPFARHPCPDSHRD
ncbi:hypothetical protein ACC695_40800, partial [Rhizobium ruizarguesonis]